MLHLILTALWNSALAQFGIAGIVLAGAVAAYIWVPLAGVRHIAVSTAAVCIVLLFLGPKFYLEGARHVQAQWKAAEGKARALGDSAHADAVRDVARGMRDPFDSDGD
jgi:hypothetical protein